MQNEHVIGGKPLQNNEAWMGKCVITGVFWKCWYKGSHSTLVLQHLLSFKKSHIWWWISWVKKKLSGHLKKIVCLHSSTLYWFFYQFHFMFIYQLIKRINYKLGKDTPTSSFDENEYMYSKYIYLSMIQRKTFFREINIEYKAFWYCGTIYI